MIGSNDLCNCSAFIQIHIKCVCTIIGLIDCEKGHSSKDEEVKQASSAKGLEKSDFTLRTVKSSF